jgi:hypothetical protein
VDVDEELDVCGLVKGVTQTRARPSGLSGGVVEQIGTPLGGNVSHEEVLSRKDVTYPDKGGEGDRDYRRGFVGEPMCLDGMFLGGLEP